MDKEIFVYICNKMEEGREGVFVNHPATQEGGEVIECTGEQMIVRTSSGEERRWDYQECEETLSRREIFPYR
ncbi:MAG: hypothetical protein IH614_11570 [Desulfuromonadales bacterium]|nr:hypothetical protein [Desulfuromonadales bacterium]